MRLSHEQDIHEPADGLPEDKRPVKQDVMETHGLYRAGLAYGRFVFRYRWVIIALWVIGLLVSVPFAAQVTSVLTGGGYNFQNSESVRVSNMLTSTLHQPPSQLLVVFQSPDTPVSDPAYQQEIRAFTDKAANYPSVIDIAPTQVGRDGRTALVVVSFNQSASDLEHKLADFRKTLPAASSGPASIYVTGDPAVYATFTQVTQSDTERAEAFALPIALVVLIIVFGTLVSALMPLVLALVAVPVALAIIYAIASHFETSVFVTNVATIVGLGISIDYSLFMIRRFRDELAIGRPVRDAIGWTVATAGEAILFSGMTVMIGFLGLLLIGIQFMTSFGIGGAVVVAAAVLAALTMLPALLSILGRRVNALKLPFVGRLITLSHEQSERHGFWRRWALTVMRHPVVVIVGVSVVLVALAWPIFSLNIGTPSASSLPASSEARRGLDIISRQYPGADQNPVIIIAQSPDGSSMLTPENLARVEHLSTWLAQQPHVTGVTSLTAVPGQPGAPALTSAQLVALYTSGRYQSVPALAQLVNQTTNDGVTMIEVRTDAHLDSPEGKALIDQLRAGDKAAGQGLTVLVGGFQATSLDFNRYVYDNFPKAILFILIATFVLLLIMFRSLLLPLKAILMNVLSVSAAYGVLVWVFQWGNFSNVLGFTATGFLDSTIPILLFCILFGLSMDYEVFLLSRIHEEWLRTHNNRYAVALGLEKTGGVITNAALLFVIVTGAFTFTSIIITKEMGLGMTVAVLVDATIIRSLLVPATMRLLGRWNWWLPGRPLPQEQVDFTP
jgi:RND superfamily putative drug exporter